MNGIDVDAGRNAFTAPPFVNLDMRFTKRFDITGRVKVDVLLEFFNVLNRQNPAAVGSREGVTTQPFGESIQVLPDEGADRFQDRVLARRRVHVMNQVEE